MPDLRWEEVRELFDPDLMGALPDIFVPGATVRDWQAVLDLVTASGWQWQYQEDGTARRGRCRPRPQCSRCPPEPGRHH